MLCEFGSTNVKMANTTLLTKSLQFSSLLQQLSKYSPQNKQHLIKATIPTFNTLRWSSFRSSHPVYDLNEYPNVEIVKNPPEWQYVERLFPKTIVPEPKLKSEYPSGWSPQTVDPTKAIYFVNRTKNHMLPVYLDKTFRGTRRITLVRRIQGDIWELELDVKKEIETRIGRKIVTRINEMSGQIEFKGDHVNIVKDYLLAKGF